MNAAAAKANMLQLDLSTTAKLASKESGERIRRIKTMSNGAKCFLILIGAVSYVFVPPMFFKWGYVESVAMWADEAVVLYLALLIVISWIMKTEEEDDRAKKK